MEIKQGHLKKDDIRIFPPKLHCFLGAYFLSLLSASVGLLTLTHFLLSGSFAHTFMAIAIYALIASYFFMRIVYGYVNAYKGLVAIAYGCIGVSTFNMITFFNERNINSLATFGLIMALLAVMVLRSKGYFEFLTFVNKRWSRYRETGVPLLEQYKLQQAQDTLRENKK